MIAHLQAREDRTPVGVRLLLHCTSTAAAAHWRRPGYDPRVFQRSDPDRFQGAWQAQQITGRGKEVPPEKAKAITFVIEGNTLKRFVNDVDRKDPATIKVDASKKPMQFDLTPAKQGDPTMLGICELD